MLAPGVRGWSDTGAQAVANERQKRASLEKDLGFIYQEIQRRQAELSKRRESKARLLDDLRRGHQSLQEVHKVLL